MRITFLLMGVHKFGLKLTSSQYKYRNTICYMIYKILNIKINQLLRKNTIIPGLERNSPLGSVSEEATLAVIFKAMKQKKKGQISTLSLSLNPCFKALFYN